jgi:hypothetical protein
MRLPAISGIIDRRILANYRVDPDSMAKVLPPPFQPQLVNGYAVGGICLIRLKNVGPKMLRLPWGIGSDIEQIESSHFGDLCRFPEGTTTFDCALLMRDIVHEWHGRPDLCCSSCGA